MVEQGRGSRARSPAGAGPRSRRRGWRRGRPGPARWPGRRCRTARRTASASRSSISSSSSVLPSNAVGQRGQGLGQRALLLAVQAAGQGQRADEPVADPLGVRGGRGEVLPRLGGLAAVEADHGGDAEVAAGGAGFLQVLVQGRHLGQRVVPAPGLEQQLAQRAVRLRPPHRRADLAGQLPGLPGRGQRLVVPVEVGQGDGLVDLQQQPQVGQPRVGLGHGQRPVEQRQRVRHVPLHPGHDRQHVQRPGHGPVVGGLGRRLERAGGDPARLPRPRRGGGASARPAPAAGPGAGPRSRARPAPRSSAASDSAAEPASIRHCASVQCRSSTISGSVAYSSARLATCSAAAVSPMR